MENPSEIIWVELLFSNYFFPTRDRTVLLRSTQYAADGEQKANRFATDKATKQGAPCLEVETGEPQPTAP